MFVLSVGNSLPSRSLKETSSIPVSSLKRVQNRLYDSTDDYSGTSQYTSGTTSTRDGITDGEEPSLQAKLKKSFNLGEKLLRRGDNLLKSLKKVKKVRLDYELRGSSSQSLSQLLQRQSICSIVTLSSAPSPFSGHNPMTLS